MHIQQAYKWLLENKKYIELNLKFRGDDLEYFYKTYNAITGENKRKSACGRCIKSMKNRLQMELKKINNMKTFKVYRTEKGNLSLKEQGDSIFTLHSNTAQGAKEALQSLKTFERQQDKKIDEKDV